MSELQRCLLLVSNSLVDKIFDEEVDAMLCYDRLSERLAMSLSKRGSCSGVTSDVSCLKKPSMMKICVLESSAWELCVFF